MSTRQYIGARYVPKFYQNSVDGSAAWESNVVYEPLTWVTLTNGHIYLSRKQVPATVGIPSQNIDYWLDVGSYNGFIEGLQNQINFINNTSIPHLQDEIDDMNDGTVAGSLQAQINTINNTTIPNVNGKIGTLTNLNTAVKTDIVSAINDALFFITPQMFGAVCDGVTDDYTAFAAACAASSANKVPLILTKDIAINGTITLNTWMTIIGAHDGVKITQLGEVDTFYAETTLYFVTLKNFQIRGTNKKGVGINLADGGVQSGTVDSNFSNLEFSNLNMGVRITGRWLACRFSDWAIHDCNHGVIWGGHDGALTDFSIWNCSEQFGGLYISGTFNRFSNGKVWNCLSDGSNGQVSITNTGIYNMLSNIDIQDGDHCGLHVRGNNTIGSGIVCSENGHSGGANTYGIDINASYCNLQFTCPNLNRGHVQKYGIKFAGGYNSLIGSCTDSGTAAYSGSNWNSFIVINGASIT